jgi:PAS domain S-box-containing protein
MHAKLFSIRTQHREVAIRGQLLMIASVLLAVAAMLNVPIAQHNPSLPVWLPYALGSMTVVCALVATLCHFGRVEAGGILLSSVLLVLTTVAAQPTDLLAGPVGAVYLIPILIAGMVIGAGGVAVVSTAAIGAFAVVAVASGEPWTPWTWTSVTIIGVSSGLLWLIIRTLEQFRAERAQAEHQARAALAALESEYAKVEQARSINRAIVDAASDGMLLVALNGVILSSNRRFAELFQLRPDDVLNHNVRDLYADAERIFANPVDLRALVKSTLQNPEDDATSVVAQQRPVPRELELFSTPVHRADRELLGRLYVFRDVTHEREIDRMKSEFVALASHELRTPLNAIQGYAEQLIFNPQGLTAVHAQCAQAIKRNGDRLVALVNDLLDVSRIEAGGLQLQRSVVDLHLVIRYAVSMLKPQFDSKQQQVHVRFGEQAAVIDGDADRIIQILINLLSNAYKYTPTGGTVTVDVQAHTDHCRIQIHDTGIGITEADQARLFTRFFRAQNHLTQQVDGTGLGLVIVRSLVELHGGTLTVESRPGHGSTFSFTLPAAAVRQPHPNTATAGD